MINEREFIIGKTKIGGSSPCFIVAEIGINFDGQYEQALALIDSAKNAGCSAVKFQLFNADTMFAKNAGEYQTADSQKRNICEIVKKGELPHDWVPNLKKYAHQSGLEFFSTVCDEESADILEKYGVDAYKIASYEITHIPLLRYVAKKKKPIIFSSGGAMLSDIEKAIRVFKEEGNRDIALLHCIAKYNAPLEILNLKTITTLRLAFPDIIVGYSDHSSDPVTAPRAAVALGAKVIEKHITLNRNLPGPDHSFALDPQELTLMVRTIRKTEEEMKSGIKIDIDSRILGTSKKETYEEEKKEKKFAYRCLFARKFIKKGELFTKENMVVLRPGNERRGLEPEYYDLLINRYLAARDIVKDGPISWDDVLSVK